MYARIAKPMVGRDDGGIDISATGVEDGIADRQAAVIGEERDAIRRVIELRNRGEELPVIAAILNAEGRGASHGAEYTVLDVWRILGSRRLVSRVRLASARAST